MPKATVTYDLADPDDTLAYKTHRRADDMALALWEILQYLRSNRRGMEINMDGPEGIEDKILAILEDRDVHPYELFNA